MAQRGCQHIAPIRSVYVNHDLVETDWNFRFDDNPLYVFRGIPDCIAISLRRVGHRRRYVPQCGDNKCFGSDRTAWESDAGYGGGDYSVCPGHNLGSICHCQEVETSEVI